MNNQYYAVVRSGQNSDDELQHWKYIKRIKDRNGKWRYIYDQSANKSTSLANERRRLSNDHNQKFEKFYKDRWTDDLRKSKTKTERDNVNRWYKDKAIKKGIRDTAYEGYDKSGHYDKYRVNSAKYYEEKHAKTVRGKVDKFMEKNGRKIAKNLNSMSDQIDKGKRKVRDLFKRIKTK